MQDTIEPQIVTARALIDDYLKKTGVRGKTGDPSKRYLWTDALAVQSCFGLSRALDEERYREEAYKLINEVHDKLGRHVGNGGRGWISGLSEEDGQKHPTAGGLRIGKKLAERKPGESYNEQLEWERDGQYFHYITRWVNTLLQASQEFQDSRFARWAAELCLAGGNFIEKNAGPLRMYWKMSIDLSRPLVPAMGAHDPLEGLICALSARKSAPGELPDHDEYVADLEELCRGTDWTTTDPLGLGGLFLNGIRVAALDQSMDLPASIKPAKLLRDSFKGMELYLEMHNPKGSALHRLAFRECGLSLGLRTLWGHKEQLEEWGYDLRNLAKYMPLADEIESFWTNPAHQAAATWTDHLDINEVSLAASLIARDQPRVFSGIANSGEAS